jgi:hypothetical protein
MAKARLDEKAARRAKKAQQRRLRLESREGAQRQAPESTPPGLPGASPTPAAPADPSEARKLVVGSAAMEAALKRRLASGAKTTKVLETVPASPLVDRR